MAKIGSPIRTVLPSMKTLEPNTLSKVSSGLMKVFFNVPEVSNRKAAPFFGAPVTSNPDPIRTLVPSTETLPPNCVLAVGTGLW